LLLSATVDYSLGEKVATRIPIPVTYNNLLMIGVIVSILGVTLIVIGVLGVGVKKKATTSPPTVQPPTTPPSPTFLRSSQHNFHQLFQQPNIVPTVEHSYH